MSGSSLHKQFKIDSKKELDGVRVEYGANGDGSIPTFIISRASVTNARYKRIAEAEAKPYRRQIDLGTLPQEKVTEINIKIFCKSLLLKWENGQDAAGKSITFSVESAITLLLELPELYLDLFNHASTASLFQSEEIEAETKNS